MNLKQIVFCKKKELLFVFGVIFILIIAPINLVGQETIDRDENVFLTPLEIGWNLVSVRYDATIDKENLIVFYDESKYNWIDAVNMGIINDYIFKWDAINQMYNFASTTDSSFGYWIFAYEPCQLWGDINVSVNGIDGGGTIGYIPKFTNATTIANSLLYESIDGNIGIGHVPPENARLYIKTNMSDFRYGLYTESQKGIKSVNTALAGTGITGEGGHAGIKGEGGYIGVIGQGFYGGWFEGKGYFSGQVGIGTRNLSAELEVNGTIKANTFVGDGSGLSNLNYIGTPVLIYTGDGFDTIGSTMDDIDDHEFPLIISDDLLGNYLKIQITCKYLIDTAYTQCRTQLKIETRPNGGSYDISLPWTTTCEASRDESNGQSSTFVWYHELTAQEKIDGVQVKISSKSEGSSMSSSEVTNLQTVFTSI